MCYAEYLSSKALFPWLQYIVSPKHLVDLENLKQLRKPELDALFDLHNFQEFFQPSKCLDLTMYSGAFK